MRMNGCDRMGFSYTDFDLIELIKSGKAECPVCRLEEERIKQSMKVLLYESVTKREFRRDIRHTRICKKHFEMFKKSVKEDLTVAGLGPAIIFKDMIESQFEVIKKPTGLTRKNQTYDCYFCRYNASLPERLINSAYNVLKTEDGFATFRNSESILCLDHFEMLKNYAQKRRDKPFVSVLTEVQSVKIETLRERLQGFIDKHDYANHQKISQEEAESINTAFNMLLKI